MDWHVQPSGESRGTLEIHQAKFGADHTAVRAIAGHLAFLNGNGPGPELDELDAMKANAHRLGICDAHRNYTG
jgi:hypothetical protein